MMLRHEDSVSFSSGRERSASATAPACARWRRLGRGLRPGIVLLLSLLPLAPLTAATITVTTLEDGSIGEACTLRDALRAAGNNAPHAGCAAGEAGHDEIVFTPGLTGTLALTEGQLEVTLPESEELSVLGSGSAELTLDAQGRRGSSRSSETRRARRRSAA